MNEQDFKELLAAIERNTSASRALAVYVLGSIPWIFGSLPLLVIGIVLAQSDSYSARDNSLLPLAAGTLIILIGVIRSIILSLMELTKSKKPRL